MRCDEYDHHHYHYHVMNMISSIINQPSYINYLLSSIVHHLSIMYQLSIFYKSVIYLLSPIIYHLSYHRLSINYLLSSIMYQPTIIYFLSCTVQHLSAKIYFYILYLRSIIYHLFIISQ